MGVLSSRFEAGRFIRITAKTASSNVRFRLRPEHIPWDRSSESRW